MAMLVSRIRIWSTVLWRELKDAVKHAPMH